MLDLPAGFPPIPYAGPATVDVQPPVLPGTELVVTLLNGCCLSLIHGRASAYCGPNTVEALIITPLGIDPPDNLTTNAGPGLMGWATGEQIADVLTRLAALPAPESE